MRLTIKLGPAGQLAYISLINLMQIVFIIKYKLE